MKLSRLALYMGTVFFSIAAYATPPSKTDITLHNVGMVLHIRILVKESKNPEATINKLEEERRYYYNLATEQLGPLTELEMLAGGNPNQNSIAQSDLHDLETEINKFTLLKELYGRNSPSALEIQKLCREYGLPEFSDQPPSGVHRPKQHRHTGK